MGHLSAEGIDHEEQIAGVVELIGLIAEILGINGGGMTHEGYVCDPDALYTELGGGGGVREWGRGWVDVGVCAGEHLSEERLVDLLRDGGRVCRDDGGIAWERVRVAFGNILPNVKLGGVVVVA